MKAKTSKSNKKHAKITVSVRVYSKADDLHTGIGDVSTVTPTKIKMASILE